MDSQQTVVRQIDCLSDLPLPVHIENVCPAGPYTVRITSAGEVDASSSFTLELIEEPELIEDNLNNNYKDAFDFPVPGSVTGRIYLQSDVDFYEFTLDTPRFLQLDFTCPGSSKDFFLTLYKESDQNLIDGIDSVGGADVTLHMGLGVGHYYLKVAGNGTDADTVNPYTLTLSDSTQTNLEIESNNTLKFANALEKDAVKKGRIYSSADIDYFRVLRS